MLKIQHLLLSAIASFVTSHATALLAKLHNAGVHFRLHLGSRFHRRRIRVRQYLGAAQAVDAGKADAS